MPVNIQLSKIEESLQLSALSLQLNQLPAAQGGEKPIADG
jgi:hypothetical protein